MARRRAVDRDRRTERERRRRDATGEVRAGQPLRTLRRDLTGSTAATARARADHDRHRSVGRATPAAGGDAAAPPVRAAALGPAGRTGAHRDRHDRLRPRHARGDHRRRRARRALRPGHALAAARGADPDRRRARRRRLRVLRQGHREGLPPGRRPRARRVRRRPAGRVLGGRSVAAAGGRVRLHRRGGRVHRSGRGRVRAAAQHGDHDARRRVDRRARARSPR